MKIHLREERMAENGEDGKDGMHYDFENLQNAFFYFILRVMWSPLKKS